MKELIIKLKDDAYAGQGCYCAKAELIVDGKSLVDEDYPLDDVTVYFNLLELQDGDETEACDWSNPDGAKLNGAWIADKFEGVNEYRGYTVKYLNTNGSVL
jgi:hypothetical protein